MKPQKLTIQAINNLVQLLTVDDEHAFKQEIIERELKYAYVVSNDYCVNFGIVVAKDTEHCLRKLADDAKFRKWYAREMSEKVTDDDNYCFFCDGIRCSYSEHANCSNEEFYNAIRKQYSNDLLYIQKLDIVY